MNVPTKGGSPQRDDYTIEGDQQELPDGRFPLTLCITRDETQALLTALEAYSAVFERDNTEHIAAVRQALAWAMTPENAPCAPCSDPEAQCISFYPQHPAFEFAPGIINGVYEDPPAGYQQNPWFTGDRYTLPGFELLPTDVLFDINSVRGDGVIAQFASGFPRTRFHWTGAAKLQLHLINVPLSGFALVRVDEAAIVDVVDMSTLTQADIEFSIEFLLQLIEGILERDFIPISIHEIDVESDGDHYVDILFLPRIEVSLNPIGWGGGLRKIVVCGTEVSCEDQVCPEPEDCGCCDDEADDDCGCCNETTKDDEDCGCGC